MPTENRGGRVDGPFLRTPHHLIGQTAVVIVLTP
jgi:hypothetical protein